MVLAGLTAGGCAPRDSANSTKAPVERHSRAATGMDGQWAGSTSAASGVTFTLAATGTMLTNFSFVAPPNAPGCPGPATVGPAPTITVDVNGNFSFTSGHDCPRWTVTGMFTSATMASGTIEFFWVPGQCNALPHPGPNECRATLTWTATLRCSGQPAPEVCNGVDDDCDGMIDNGLVPTTCGSGICQVTQSSCMGGVPQTCMPGMPGTETCNTLDDDCNGTADDLGSTTCGVGVCERTVVNCVGGATQTCTPGAPGTETCNTLDDDCNGTADDLGSTTCGVGVCERTVVNCMGGVTQTCTPGPSGTETCNGLDDDCDGTPDDGLGDTTCGMGTCQRTVASCMGGMPQTCTPGAPGSETCNGLDDDCDGTPDDSLGDTTCGMGTCQRTVASCMAGVPQTCMPGAPGSEICNGMDDDCDGTPDNGLGSTSCGMGACQRTVANCMGGAPQTCVPGAPGSETCNGLDDDCDGQADNGFELAATCTVGVGACARPGLTKCSQDGSSTVCDGTPGQPGTETCNGADDDCDGTIDNGFDVGTPCGPAAATCSQVKVCAGDGTTTICSGGGVLGAELCDGKDNDCDGNTDNGFGVGGSCMVGLGACQRPGSKICSADKLGTVCAGNPGLPATETCDGVDNDCDGQIDDGFSLGAGCTVGVGGCVRPGTRMCTPDGLGTVCTGTGGQSAMEVCDRQDNDCDGEVDEGFDVGAACMAGVGECRRAGVLVCTADGMGATCDVPPGAAGMEICGNGKDDDCDGMTDEACMSGDGGIMDSGVDRPQDAGVAPPDAPSQDAASDARGSDGALDAGADAPRSDATAATDSPAAIDTRPDGGGASTDATGEADGGEGVDADPTPPGIRIAKGGGCDCSVSGQAGRNQPSLVILLGICALALSRRGRRRAVRGTRPKL